MNTEIGNLYYRQKVLLGLLQAFGGRLANVDMQKLLFLYTNTCQKDKSYDFVPYRFGCFSFQSYADRRKLLERGLLADVEGWELATSNVDFLSDLKLGEAQKISLFKSKYGAKTATDLIQEVYRKFPYFAVKSEIASKVLSAEELAAVEAEKPADDKICLFTIGYEGSSFENYLNRLIRANVRLLCDVRKNPISRKYGFSKRTLSETLKKLGIEYLHVPELGIVSEKRQSLASASDYQALFDEYEVAVLNHNPAKLELLLQVVQDKKRVALTCFEAEQCFCHRGRIVSALQSMPEWRYEVVHL